MRRTAVSVLAVGLSMAVIVPAGAQSSESDLEDVQQEIAALTAQINTNRAESARVGEQLVAAEARLSTVRAELATAEANVAAIETQIADQESLVSDLEAEVAALEVQLIETSGRIAETEQRLSIQAVEMYMNASMSVGTVVLGFDTVDDLTVGMSYADEVAGNSEDLLDTFEFLRVEEDRQRTAVEANRLEAQGVLESLDAERVLLETEVARVADLRDQAAAELQSVQSLLASIRRDIAAAEQHKDGLEAEAARIEAEIAAASRSDGEPPGRLRMPVDGWISSYYGYRTHPIFGTRKLHTGIDLAAIGGTPIYAAESGTVIIAGSRTGYGSTVVIDHGGGVATLYAHQSRLTVSVGEQVDAGERIGFVGCTGYCTGDHLHFEVHENGRHTDPLGYLRG